jgi:hypothetical protein
MRNRVTKQCTVFTTITSTHDEDCDVRKLYLSAQQQNNVEKLNSADLVSALKKVLDEERFLSLDDSRINYIVTKVTKTLPLRGKPTEQSLTLLLNEIYCSIINVYGDQPTAERLSKEIMEKIAQH